MKIFVTGVTGFLGAHYLEQVKNDSINEYFFLIRETSKIKILDHYLELEHFHFIFGDITHPDLITDSKVHSELTQSIEKVVHLAALYDLRAQQDQLYRVNVIGTQYLLYFCEQLKKLKQVDYASTIAVAGNHSGTFSENDFNLGQSFNDSYGYTKFQAESIVRNFCVDNQGKISCVIFRFGIIVGDSQTGEIDKIDGPYYFFEKIAQFYPIIKSLNKVGKIVFPFKADAILPIVSVDNCVKALIEMNSHESRPKGQTCLHIVFPDAPIMKNFLEDFLSVVNINLSVSGMPKIFGLGYLVKLIGLPREVINYLYVNVEYDLTNYQQYVLSKNKSTSYSRCKNNLFSYAKNKFFKI